MKKKGGRRSKRVSSHFLSVLFSLSEVKVLSFCVGLSEGLLRVLLSFQGLSFLSHSCLRGSRNIHWEGLPFFLTVHDNGSWYRSSFRVYRSTFCSLLFNNEKWWWCPKIKMDGKGKETSCQEAISTWFTYMITHPSFVSPSIFTKRSPSSVLSSCCCWIGWELRAKHTNAKTRTTEKKRGEDDEHPISTLLTDIG